MKKKANEMACNPAPPLYTQLQEMSRREAISKSAIAIGSCYLAPATLNLLLADRATAQSISANTISIRNNNTLGIGLFYSYTDANNLPVSGTLHGGNTKNDNVMPGTNISLVFTNNCLRINGANTNHSFSITAHLGANIFTITNC